MASIEASSDRYSSWTLNLLKVECGRLGLKKSGKKQELLDRYVVKNFETYFQEILKPQRGAPWFICSVQVAKTHRRYAPVARGSAAGVSDRQY